MNGSSPTPVTLDSVVGHIRVVASLRSALASGNIHHAMLFAGPEGVGKLAVARALAASVNCLADMGASACGDCRSCRRILSRDQERDTGHPDVIEVRPDGRQIKIAQIRDLIRVVAFPPIEARVRVVIIEPADALGDEAANALLKTLEEPSSHTRFILCSSAPDALLITIRSRCQRVVFGRLTVDEVAHLLHERFGVEARRATEVAAVSDGRVGHALALLEDPVMSRRAELLNRLLAISPGDTDACFEFAGELYELRQRAETLFDMLARLYRDVLMVRVGAEHAADSGDDELRAAIERTSGRYGTRALLARLELIEDTRHGLLDRNLNPRLSLERLVVALTSAAGDEGISFRVEALTRAGR